MKFQVYRSFPILSVRVLLLLLSAVTTAECQPPLGPAGVQSNPQQPVFTFHDVDQAWEVVQQSQRPLLLFVSMKNCVFCDKMEAETYAHPLIARGIHELFVTAKMKKEQDPQLMRELGVRAYPTTLLIAPSGDLIARIEGFADPKKFVSTIRPALAAHNQAQQRTAQATGLRQ